MTSFLRLLIAHVSLIYSALVCVHTLFPPSCCLCLCHTVLYIEDIIVSVVLLLVMLRDVEETVPNR